MSGKAYVYDCKVCCKSQTSGKALTAHLKNIHGLSAEVYYLQYILKRDSVPVCECGCGQPVEFINFKRGFRKCVSKSCHITVLNRDPEFARRHSERTRERNLRPEIRQRSSEQFTAMNHRRHADPEICKVRDAKAAETLRATIVRLNADPEFKARQRVRSATNIVKASQSLHEYRKAHGGRTPSEERLYQELLKKGYFVRSNDRRFYPDLGCIVDLCMPDVKVCIELDGWTHKNTSETDAKRDQSIREKGWKTLRFKNEDVEKNIDLILSAIDSVAKEDVVSG